MSLKYFTFSSDANFELPRTDPRIRRVIRNGSLVLAFRNDDIPDWLRLELVEALEESMREMANNKDFPDEVRQELTEALDDDT